MGLFDERRSSQYIPPVKPRQAGTMEWRYTTDGDAVDSAVRAPPGQVQR